MPKRNNKNRKVKKRQTEKKPDLDAINAAVNLIDPKEFGDSFEDLIEASFSLGGAQAANSLEEYAVLETNAAVYAANRLPELAPIYFDSRLGELVSIGDSVKKAVRDTLIDGYNKGENLNDMINRVRDAFNSKASVSRARTISRTETLIATSQGEQLTYKNLGIEKQEWLSVGDSHVRDKPVSHRLDGEVVGLDQRFSNGMLRPGKDPRDRPAAIINCRCVPGETVVSGNVYAAQRSQYSGQLIKVETSSGNVLSLTPNHEVLTPNGFVRAKDLNLGDEVVSDGANVNLDAPGRNIDDGNREVSIEEIFDSLSDRRAPVALRSLNPTEVDFNGDEVRFNNNVDLVLVDQFLRGYHETPADQRSTNLSLILADVASIGLATPEATTPPSLVAGSHSIAGLGCGQVLPFEFLLFGSSPLLNTVASEPSVDGASTGVMLLGEGEHTKTRLVVGEKGASVGRAEVPSKVSLFPGGSDVNVEFSKPPLDDPEVNSTISGELVDRGPALVFADEIVRIFAYEFSGHVFDVSCIEGAMVSNGIVTRNCSTLPVIEDNTAAEEFGEGGFAGDIEPDKPSRKEEDLRKELESLVPDLRKKYADLSEDDAFANIYYDLYAKFEELGGSDLPGLDKMAFINDLTKYAPAIDAIDDVVDLAPLNAITTAPIPSASSVRADLKSMREFIDKNADDPDTLAKVFLPPEQRAVLKKQAAITEEIKELHRGVKRDVLSADEPWIDRYKELANKKEGAGLNLLEVLEFGKLDEQVQDLLAVDHKNHAKISGKMDELYELIEEHDWLSDDPILQNRGLLRRVEREAFAQEMQSLAGLLGDDVAGTISYSEDFASDRMNFTGGTKGASAFLTRKYGKDTSKKLIKQYNRERTQQANFYDRVVDEKYKPRIGATVYRSNGGRSFADPSIGEVVIDSDRGTDTSYVHEWGHIMEEGGPRNPDKFQDEYGRYRHPNLVKSERFLWERGVESGDIPERLVNQDGALQWSQVRTRRGKEVFDWAGADEHFIALEYFQKVDDILPGKVGAYAGKVYRSGASKNNLFATELVSIGMEMLYRAPLKFAETMPEYFDFMLDVISAGKIKPE